MLPLSSTVRAVLHPITCELGDHVFHAGILPDQRIVHRLARLAIPHDGGFALIRDADRGEVLWPETPQLHGFNDYFLSAPPDFLRIVFYSPCLRIDQRACQLAKCPAVTANR
jgi:hypothetical protein